MMEAAEDIPPSPLPSAALRGTLTGKSSLLNKTSVFLETLSQFRVKRQTDSDVIDKEEKKKTAATPACPLPECTITTLRKDLNQKFLVLLKYCYITVHVY